MINSISIIINFIGAGRVGKTIAKQIVDSKVATIQGVCNRSLESGKKAIAFIGQGKAFAEIQELPPADVTFITTYDDVITNCCQNLTKSCNLKTGSIILHCSGSFSSDLLISLKEKDCYIASVHPMRSFSIPFDINRDYNNYCTFEGDAEALNLLSYLFKTMNYSIHPIDKENKSIYHAAGVFASNYLVTLFESALSCLKNAGITKENGFKVILNLMKNTIDNLEFTQSTETALTGPISRGDLEVIRSHLQALSKTNLIELYKVLGLSTLTLTNLTDSKKEAFAQMFSLLIN
ncbi:Rossmann-like and DUF2520 domain-containing protein [Coxiella endosymbiont of Dermacentor marginatus]|uniref:Rossmann-like and DUF2520 domain-containing protein n=1 Tax=Coxiella endosymbiont of Dermacentor marginatus TaxID=1656159 RepID=UPI00222158B1|nr:Rossmann-like and DUF2520 domain-containing protein [Coxiella endosymbiont of Dermacentor marginatus]